MNLTYLVWYVRRPQQVLEDLGLNSVKFSEHWLLSVCL